MRVRASLAVRDASVSWLYLVVAKLAMDQLVGASVFQACCVDPLFGCQVAADGAGGPAEHQWDPKSPGPGASSP